MSGFEAVDAAYTALLDALTNLDDDTGWRSTRCVGWTVRDLVHHLLSDAQRALVALHTPAEGPTDVDAVSYWKDWQPGTGDADAERRGTRITASVWTSVSSITALYAGTARAVLVAGRDRAGSDVIATQGHVLTVDSLLSTLAVEATVHQLDLGLGSPSARGLEETCAALDGLLGRVSPLRDAVRYVLIGTGREPLTDQERAVFGDDSRRFPLFG